MDFPLQDAGLAKLWGPDLHAPPCTPVRKSERSSKASAICFGLIQLPWGINHRLSDRCALAMLEPRIRKVPEEQGTEVCALLHLKQESDPQSL